MSDTAISFGPHFLSPENVISLKPKAISNLYKATYESSVLFSTLAPADSFWKDGAYTDEQTIIGKRACILLWHMTCATRVPRTFQLEATMRLLTQTDGLVNVGTGYGKTYCMLLPTLLNPKTISLVFSPLKALESAQVAFFNENCVNAITINSDTKNTPELWKVGIFCNSEMIYYDV